MLVFFGCVVLLILGYVVYGAAVDRIFGSDPARPTPATTLEDGVDFVPFPTWKVFLVQLLDIAGIGPIFGPILGALYGPIALVWIVIGCIFAGAVHDYLSGMLSIRGAGRNIPEVVGDNMGTVARWALRGVSVLLLVLVGVVFVLSPAKVLNELTGVATPVLVAAIFAYYFLATVVPVDQIIGRLYPFFGALLLIMTFGVGGGLLLGSHRILPNLDVFANTHPKALPAWPLLFVTLSCGAISGFHSTQSPLMARCLRTEKHGRLVFYGAMIAEGVIGLVWATVGLSFYDSPEALQEVIAKGTPSLVVNEVCNQLLGSAGGFLALLGVVALPITSGDTAFRSTRLILAETFGIEQKAWSRRLAIAVPLFAVGYVITKLPFQKIWVYFGWSNQTLAALVLWAGAVHLAREKRFHWIATVPAVFMTAVSLTFILQAKIGFRLPYDTSVMLGAALSLAAFGFFLWKACGRRASSDAQGA